MLLLIKQGKTGVKRWCLLLHKLGNTRQTSRQTSSSLGTNENIHKIWFILWLTAFMSPLLHFPQTLSVHLNACGDANFTIFLDAHELIHFVPFSILYFKGNYSRTHFRKRKIQGKWKHCWFPVHPLRRERAQYCCAFIICTCILTLHILASKLLAKSTTDYVFKIQKGSVFGK